MLALKLGMSLGGSNRPMGVWLPTDEASVVAWYQKGEGITLNGSNVSDWADSATAVPYDMAQTNVNEQPAYSAGVLTFDPTTYTQNLQTSSQISLSGQFTVGVKCNPAAYNNVLIGDNTTTNEFFKFLTGGKILRIKTDASNSVDITLNGSDTFGDDYIVITRNGSNLITVNRNGVAQTDTETLAGTADIDAIGVRSVDTNPYDGTVSELQIFSSTSAALTADVNNRLSNL